MVPGDGNDDDDVGSQIRIMSLMDPKTNIGVSFTADCRTPRPRGSHDGKHVLK